MQAARAVAEANKTLTELQKPSWESNMFFRKGKKKWMPMRARLVDDRLDLFKAGTDMLIFVIRSYVKPRWYSS